MLRSRHFVQVAFLLAAVALPAAGQSPAPVEFAFPQHIAPQCDNLFVAGDCLPPLRKLLSSEAFNKLTTTGKFKDLLARGGVDPSQAPAKLDEHAAYVPSEVAVAFPSTTYGQIVAVIKTALTLSLSSGATDAGGAAIDEELPKIQTLLLDAVRQLQMPEFTVWIRFRDPQIAERAFAAVAGVAGPLGERTGLHAEVSDDSIHIEFTMGELMPPEAFPAILVGAGVASDPDDPNLAAVGETLANFEAEAWFERRGDSLRIIVGPRSNPDDAYEVADLGPLWRADDSLLIYGKWKLVAFKSGIAEVEQLWQQWRDTAAGKAIQQWDDEDLLGDLVRIAADARNAADSGSLQVTLGDALEAVIHEQGAKRADPLAGSPVLAFIPRDAEFTSVTSIHSLADNLSATLSNFEERLGRNSLKAELGNRPEQIELHEKVSSFYYGELGEFRRLAHDGADDLFSSPVAALAGSTGSIGLLEIAFDDAQDLPNRVTLRDLPMLEYAVVAHMADADRAKDFPDDLARAFFAAFFDDLPESLVKSRDLGLGVETFAFSGEVFDRLPHNIAIAVEGDLQPHYFLLDDWLVFSTSARLSKSILAARENADQRLEPPAVESGDLVAFGRFPAELAASYLDHIGKFLGAVTAGGDNVELQGPTAIQFRTDDLNSLIETFPALAEAVRMVEGAEWTTVDRDNLRETRFRAAFAP